MKQRITTIAMVAALAGACGNSNEEQQQAQQQADQLAAQLTKQLNEAAMQAVPAPTPTPTAAPAAAGGSNFGTVTLAPGFPDDPHKASGTSGGAINAQTLDATCAGWVSATPDHLLQATGAFSNLRVMAKATNATDDITLVVQRPDGTYLCNDDSDGLNPLVAGPFAAGTYKIWLGSYEEGANAAYTLGFSELESVGIANL